MKRRIAFCVSIMMVGYVLAQGPALTIQREGFEGPQTAWRKGPTTVVAREEAHTLTQQFAHSAPASEYFRVAADDPGAELNPLIHYSFPTQPAPVNDETAGSLWVRASRPGVQIFAKIVLSRERDPRDSNAYLTALVPGDKYTLAGGRWQRLELRRVKQLLVEERQRLRAKWNKDIDVTDAYVDEFIINVYAGPGVTEVWVDDLELSPVVAAVDVGQSRSESRSKEAPAPPPPGVKPIGPSPVEFQRDQLRVGGRPILIRGIRHTDTPLKALREAGLNTLFFSGPTTQPLAEEATKLGFYLVPSLDIAADTDTTVRDVVALTGNENVLAWHLGEWRPVETLDAAARTSTAIRAADPHHPVACDVRDGFWSYSRHVDLVGAHRWPLFTSLEFSRYRDWLVQRRNLCRPNTYMWTWVQSHLPDWYLDVVQPPRANGGFTEPVGPHPEQIRLLTYLSLAAGMKGIAYYSDRSLSDAQQGRDRLLQIALVNQEIMMLEPLLVTAVDPPTWIDTSTPQVKAAVFRTERGVLVLPIWLGDGTQYVPEQGASPRLVITVPQVPIGTQAWEVSPGEVRSLPVQRVVGGTQVTLTEFDHAAAIVFTADTSPTGLLVRWQEQNRRMGPTASQWTYDLANVTLAKVERVQAQLTQLGVALPDSESLMRAAREKLQASRTAWEAGDHRTAYREAQRAERPLRVLARSQWASLIKGLDTPTASPYGASYYSLPQHVAMLRSVSASSPGENLLPDGDFENGQDGPTGWQLVRNTLDDVEMNTRFFRDSDGQKSLALEVKPKSPPPGTPATPPPLALERTYLAAESSPVRLTPGSLVRISFKVKVPVPIKASADGLVVYDSAGGETLGVRIVDAIPQWKKFTLYRQVPANGEVRVAAALTGLGVALLDDVKIEPLVGK